jgi:hypothetical protein
MPVLDPTRVSEEATRLGIDAVAAYLQEQLGQKLTAYLAGVTDPKMVGRWAAGKAQPRDEREMRLRGGSAPTRGSTTARPPPSCATPAIPSSCASWSRPPARSPGARPERRRHAGLAPGPPQRAAGLHPAGALRLAGSVGRSAPRLPHALRRA